jgi:hypothetical protein
MNQPAQTIQAPATSLACSSSCCPRLAVRCCAVGAHLRPAIGRLAGRPRLHGVAGALPMPQPTPQADGRNGRQQERKAYAPGDGWLADAGVVRGSAGIHAFHCAAGGAACGNGSEGGPLKPREGSACSLLAGSCYLAAAWHAGRGVWSACSLRPAPGRGAGMQAALVLWVPLILMPGGLTPVGHLTRSHPHQPWDEAGHAHDSKSGCRDPQHRVATAVQALPPRAAAGSCNACTHARRRVNNPLTAGQAVASRRRAPAARPHELTPAMLWLQMRRRRQVRRVPGGNVS